MAEKTAGGRKRPKSEVRSQKPEARSQKLDAGSRGSGKDLLIVESPTKARTIAKLLAGRMNVLSSRGHIADLPKSRLGVNIEHGFELSLIHI